MTHTCPACGSVASPLEACPRCGEFVPVTVTPKQATIPGLMPPLSAEIDSLRAQLSVARAQTASDRELIVELRGALETAYRTLAYVPTGHTAEHQAELLARIVDLLVPKIRAVLGKVSP